MDNVERIRRLYEAWSAGDLDTAIAGMDPDVEWLEPADSPDARAWRGAEGIVASMEKWTEPFEDFGFAIVEMVPAGERVLVQLHQHARGRGSGAEVEGDIWHLWTLVDGKAVKAEMFSSREEALAAAESPVHPGGAA